MKKLMIMLLVFTMAFSCLAAGAFAEFESAIGLTEWMASGQATGANTQAFLSGAENRPSKDEVSEMLRLANSYFQCHGLTGAHFVVIQDADRQAEILSMFTQFTGLDTTGTVMVLVMADGVKDQEHHAAQYYPGSSQENGGNPEYWNMYYGIYEAGWASGYLNLVARDMGYRTRAYAALNIPNVETGTVNFSNGGKFEYINGENWEISEYMTSKDGTEAFDHYVMALDDTIPLEGNVTLLCAIIIGSIDEADAVTGATANIALSEKRTANYDFWDWDDNYVPGGNAALDLSAVPDGTYSGVGTDMHGDITVQVTVEGGKIIGIEVDEASKELMISTEDVLKVFFDSVITAQSTDVDGISGATIETTALKDAITLALQSAKGE